MKVEITYISPYTKGLVTSGPLTQEQARAYWEFMSEPLRNSASIKDLEDEPASPDTQK